MNQKQLNDTELADDIYLPKNIPVVKIVLFGLVAMALGLLINFPIVGMIESKVRSAILENPNCPIQTQQFQFRVFPPRLNMNGVQIAGSCFQNPGQSLQFDSLSFGLTRPSFYPVGLLFNTVVKSKTDNLNVSLSVGIPSPKFRLYPSKLDTKNINVIAGTGNLLRGDLNFEGQGTLDWGFDLKNMSLIVRSTNLVIPAQTIQGLQLPSLNFGSALLKLRVQDHTDVLVEEMIIGSETSPMTASLRGRIDLNQTFLGSSELSLNTDLFMAEDLINSFPIVNLFLGSYAQGDGKFQFLLTGPLSSPRFSRP